MYPKKKQGLTFICWVQKAWTKKEFTTWDRIWLKHLIPHWILIRKAAKNITWAQEITKLYLFSGSGRLGFGLQITLYTILKGGCLSYFGKFLVQAVSPVSIKQLLNTSLCHSAAHWSAALPRLLGWNHISPPSSLPSPPPLRRSHRTSDLTSDRIAAHRLLACLWRSFIYSTEWTAEQEREGQ